MQPKAAQTASALNARLRRHSATDILRQGFDSIPKLALVSSFGAESVVLLHLASVINRDVPVLFIDTRMLFTETLVYQLELAERLALRNVQIIRPQDTAAHDPQGDLHRRDPDACCALRKTEPLDRALSGYDGWITGRKRFQSGIRAQLEVFEPEAGTNRIKVNPLAHWTAGDVQDYMEENRLPRHPLVAKGYPSIGCAPCTSPAGPNEDLRAGRWRGAQKDECGIHFDNGKVIRKGENA